MMRARPLPMLAKAERAVATLGRRTWRRLLICCSRRRRHPLAIHIDVTATLLRRGSRHLPWWLRCEVLLERVTGEFLNRYSAPPLGAVIQADSRALTKNRDRLRGNRRLFAHANCCGGVRERVLGGKRLC